MHGKSEQEIATTLENDKQLAAMWVSFVLHDHWVNKHSADDGSSKWFTTDKGKDLLKKYEK